LLTTSSTTLRRIGVALLLFAPLLPFTGCKSAAGPEGGGDYAAAIQQIVGSPKLDSLRWPDYTDLQPQVQKFYAGRSDNPAWLRDGQPTASATALLQLFHDAALKGLNPEDYDASRWPARLQKLEQIRSDHDTSDSAKTAVAEFDAALTISAMRYLGDLHEGRINPQSLNFDFDQPGKRAAFDVAAFLNDKVVDATDVPSVAASVEPQNPLYKSTEAALPRYLALAAQPPAVPLPGIGTAKPIDIGGSYPALAPLLARLQLDGDAPAPAAPPRSSTSRIAPASPTTASSPRARSTR
jgi:murein L,D-transpeptidase YcbB/YkuD